MPGSPVALFHRALASNKRRSAALPMAWGPHRNISDNETARAFTGLDAYLNESVGVRAPARLGGAARGQPAGGGG